MKKNTKKKAEKTKEALGPEEETTESGEPKKEGYFTNSPIYNFFQFFIGGPNHADTTNKQQGKPAQPPY